MNLVIKMTDKELIMKLGGVGAVSNHLGLSYQCVFNWLKRGIPATVKLENRDIFLADNPEQLEALPASDSESIENPEIA